VEQQQKEKELKSSVDRAMGRGGNSSHDWMHHFSRPRFRSPIVSAAHQTGPQAMNQDSSVGAANASTTPVRRRSYPSQPSSSTDFRFPVRFPPIPRPPRLPFCTALQ
jgi:hypothetical protein